VRTKPRSRQLPAAVLLLPASTTALTRPDPPERRSVAAVIAERARRLASRRIGRCPACGHAVRSGDDLVRIEGAVFHVHCAGRSQGR
jgi:hypothetical protein